MITRAKTLKYIRRVLDANFDRFLESSGMDFYHDRFFYKYTDEAIYFAEIDSTGSFRGEHWKSLGCTLHIYYINFPGLGKPPVHESGRLIPSFRQSRLRFIQDRTIDQKEIYEKVQNTTLAFDRSIWHVLEDESNISLVLSDMAAVLRDSGLPLVQKEIYSRTSMLRKEAITATK